MLGVEFFQNTRHYLNPTGQPGLGDAFMQWVWENQAVDDRCEQVGITLKDGPTEDYTEFPVDPFSGHLIPPIENMWRLLSPAKRRRNFERC